MEKKKFTTKKFLFIFALLGIFFSFFQPTCGAFTRVTDSEMDAPIGLPVSVHGFRL